MIDLNCKNCDFCVGAECRRKSPHARHGFPSIPLNGFCGEHSSLREHDRSEFISHQNRQLKEKDARIKELESDFEHEKINRLHNHALEKRLSNREEYIQKAEELINLKNKRIQDIEGQLRIANHKIEELTVKPHESSLNWWQTQQINWIKEKKALEKELYNEKIKGDEWFKLYHDKQHVEEKLRGLFRFSVQVAGQATYKLTTGTCAYSRPGRGDCLNAIGLPGISIPGQHDGDDDTVDAYGKPNGWCWFCWLSYQLEQFRQHNTDLYNKWQRQLSRADFLQRLRSF